MSPVRYQPSAVNAAGGGVGVVPVALEEGRAAELDLAVVGDPQLDPAAAAARPSRARGPRGVVHVPKPVSVAP